MTHWSVRIHSEKADRSLSSITPSDGEFVIEESLGYLVNRAARTMARDLAEELRPTGVGVGQWAVLMFLWARDGLTQTELSTIVAIEPPTMARNIDRMVRDGLVSRVPDPDDGRVSRIHLTKRGRALRDALVPRAVAVNTKAQLRMTVREARTLRRLLVKVAGEDDVAGNGS